MASSTQAITQTKPAENWFEETSLWKIKVWLQFTGWLLYLANLVAVLVMLAVAGLGAWIGVAAVVLVWLPLGIAGILAANLVFDILTVRYDLRPTEPVPAPRTSLDTFDLIRARVSCRSFQSRDLTPEHRQQLLANVHQQCAPEKQLGTHQIRFEYIAAPLTVWPVVGGHEFLVAIAPAKYNRLSVIDIGRSLQNIVIHATRMGLSTCWIGPGADQNSIAQQLGDRFDAARDHVICICAVGYASRFKPIALRGMQKSQRNRLPLADLFFANAQLSVPLDTTAAPFDVFGRCYEICQWSPSSYNGQTTRCAAVTEDGTLVRFDFCAATPSKYYAAVALGIWCANWEMGCKALDRPGHLSVAPTGVSHSDASAARPPCDVSWTVG